MYCPNCGSNNPDDSDVCISCGENLNPSSRKVNLSKSSGTAGASSPVKARKVSPKSIVSMVLGIAGLNFATLAPIYAIIAVVASAAGRSYSYSSSYYAAEIAAISIIAIVFGAVGLGLGIPALILSPRGLEDGTAPANRGISKCGRITGTISVILSGISVTAALFAMLSAF